MWRAIDRRPHNNRRRHRRRRRRWLQGSQDLTLYCRLAFRSQSFTLQCISTVPACAPPFMKNRTWRIWKKGGEGGEHEGDSSVKAHTSCQLSENSQPEWTNQSIVSDNRPVDSTYPSMLSTDMRHCFHGNLRFFSSSLRHRHTVSYLSKRFEWSEGIQNTYQLNV